MPNWCFNRLHIDGTPEAVSICLKRIADARDDGDGLCASTVPCAPDADQHRRAWGMKWDIPLSEIDNLDALLDGHTDEVQFSSANAPPLAWAQATTAAIPGLILTIAYCERGNDFAGWCRTSQGQIEEDETTCESLIARHRLADDGPDEEVLDVLMGAVHSRCGDNGNAVCA